MRIPALLRAVLTAEACALALACAGCSGSSSLDASDAGKSSAYQPGTTSFDMEAVPVRAEVESGIDLYVSIPPPSLTYTRVPAGFQARYELVARLTDRISGEFIAEYIWPETTLVAAYESTQKFEPFITFRHIPAPAGKYVVDVTLEDVSNGLKASRAQAVAVMDPTHGRPAIGRMFLQFKRADGRFVPQVSFHVSGTLDSLRCAVDVYNLPLNAALPVDIEILKFRADTSWALPPHTYSVMYKPMGYGIISLDRADTVIRIARSVAVSRKKETLVFYLPPLAEGLYRFDLQVTTPVVDGSADTNLVASRFYSIRGSGFPRPVTIRELIDAAAYLATEKEMAEMRGAGTPERQRARFEAFWLNFAKEPAAASALLKRYYTRIEEANRLFTTVREGWRTDRGMIYVILGPPADITNHLDTQTWHFSLPGGQAVNTFTFKRVVRQGEGISVEEYILFRRSYYEIYWDRMVAKWRGGEAF